MEKERSSHSENYIDIRYNKIYIGFTALLAIIFFTILFISKDDDGTSILISLSQNRSWGFYFIIIVCLIFLGQIIFALGGARYVRLDKQAKKVIVYGSFFIPAWKYKFERLFFKGKGLYREINGKIKFINIIYFQCRKDDFEAFVNEINKDL